jgi:nonsense-mediated mRNA decay protein 3
MYLYDGRFQVVEMVTTSSLFCPKCGKETQHEGLCTTCFMEKFVVFEVPEVLEVKVCPKCPSYKVGAVWTSTDIEDRDELTKKAAAKIIKLAVTFNKESKHPKLAIDSEFINPKILRSHLTVEADVQERHVVSEKDVEVRIRNETCDVCSRMAGGYYEAILQIRATDRFPNKVEVARCLKIADNVISHAEKVGDRLAFVTDVQELPEGTDIYMGSMACTRQIARAIADEFGGTVSESPKLVGEKDGKGLYRVTFAVRLPNIVPGDIVRMYGKPVVVEKVGKRIGGTDLTTGNNTSMMFEGKLEKLSDRSKAIKTVLVSEDAGSVQILDPVSYMPLTIKKPIFLNKNPGDDVWVVKISDGVFLLPGGERGKE